MKKALYDRIHKLILEEEEHDVSYELLDELRLLATEETIILDFNPNTRNALNVFFREIKSVMFNELMAGNYGAEVIVEAAIVLSFEIGYKLRETKQLN